MNRSIRIAGLTLATTVGLLGFSLWTRASVPPLSREALVTSFDAGIRNLVVEWDTADPRPEAERRRALFDFIYQTYQASAWIPQSIFDGNLVTQAIAGDVETIVREKVGLVVWRDNALVPAFAWRRMWTLEDLEKPRLSNGRSTASCVIPRKSTASPTSARARRCSTISGSAKPSSA